MPVGALLSAAVLSATNVPRHFSWFSYGAKHEATVLLNATWATMLMDEHLPFLINETQRTGLPGMLMLPGVSHCKAGEVDKNQLCLWNETSKHASHQWLANDWPARAKFIGETIGQHKLAGLQIGDELVCGGLPLGNLSAVTAAVRAAMPAGAFMYTNECFRTGAPCKADADCRGSGAGPATCESHHCEAAAWEVVPPAIDYISLDAYKDHYETEAREAHAARSEYKRFLSKGLAPHQKFWLVPGMFGQDYGPGGAQPNATLMAAQDAALVAKLRGYWEWACEDETVDGLMPWHWPSFPDAFSYKRQVLGAESFPRLREAVASYVEMIRAAR